MKEEKVRERETTKGTYLRAAIVMIAALFLLTACKQSVLDEGREVLLSSTESVIESQADNYMGVYFLDVGQGDCTLIKNGQYTMLIDAGDNDQTVLVLQYLIHLNVEKLDYLILTHTDADHIGGADAVLTHFPVEYVFMGDYPKDNDTYRDVLEALDRKGLSFSTPPVGSTYALGDADFTIVGPNDRYDTPNNTSLALLLEKGEMTFLFTGDAEKEAESDMIESGIPLLANVYQVGHHGSVTSSTEEFLDAVDPQFAVISCGVDNDYGYPHEETLEKLRERHIAVFRTDEQSSILVSSDGVELHFTSLPGLKQFSSDITYVCNIRSMKFHLPNCENAGQIAEHNRLEVCLTRESVIAMGYEPCGACKP